MGNIGRVSVSAAVILLAAAIVPSASADPPVRREVWYEGYGGRTLLDGSPNYDTTASVRLASVPDGPDLNQTDRAILFSTNAQGAVAQPAESTALPSPTLNPVLGSAAFSAGGAITPGIFDHLTARTGSQPTFLAISEQPTLSAISDTPIVPTRCRTEAHLTVDCATVLPEIASLAEAPSVAAATMALIPDGPLSNSTTEEIDPASLGLHDVVAQGLPAIISEAPPAPNGYLDKGFWDTPGSYTQVVTDENRQIAPSVISAALPDPIPEPSSLALLGASLIALGLLRRRR